MTLHPDHDSADENDGKYCTDEKMTFDEVLKSSLKEQSDDRERLDDLVERDRTESSSMSDIETRTEQSQRDGDHQREDSASNARTSLATAIGQAHVSDQRRHRIASGETTQIGQHTTYQFARTKINDSTYYYVVQNTDQCYTTHQGKLAVKDFGTEWDYTVPDVNAEALETVIAQQRRADLRADREPIAWLTDDQYEAVNDWYQAEIDLELCALEACPRQRDDTVHLLDRYLVVDRDEQSLGVGGGLQALTDRQADLVRGEILRLVQANIDLPQAIIDHLRESVDYPILARVTFESE